MELGGQHRAVLGGGWETGRVRGGGGGGKEGSG